MAQYALSRAKYAWAELILLEEPAEATSLLDDEEERVAWICL